MIEIEGIKSALAKAIATKGILRVHNYTSSTTGEVTELLEARYHGPGLYHAMVRETLEMLKTGEDYITIRPMSISVEDWEKAFNDQRASWEKSLEPNATPTASREKSYDRDPTGFLVNKVRPDTLGIEDLRLLSAVPKMPDTNYKNGVTEAKALMRWRSPLSRYIGILTLTPEKADGIEVVEDAHE